MIREQKVQVVLGEAERTDGLLRFVLEGEGFDIVGLASNDQELLRVVNGARPDVVVLDAGISAPAAMEARKRVDGAPLVVVWPDGVAAVLAEERVDPFDSISDLGDAVRRAAELGRRQTSARVEGKAGAVPSAVPIAEDGRASAQTATIPVRSRGRRSQLVIAAATWMVALTALTAIAITLPNAMDPSPRHGGGRPSSGASVTREPNESTASGRTGDTTDRTRGDAARKDKDADRGKDEVRDRGRPDDPGSQADRERPSHQEPPDGSGAKKDSRGSVEDGPGPGNAGGTEKSQEHSRAANSGRTERSNSG
jgi:hypothetical protein